MHDIKKWISENPDDIDKEILLLIRALNSLEWIVTLESCSGHGKKDAYIVLRILGEYGIFNFSCILDQLVSVSAHMTFSWDGYGEFDTSKYNYPMWHCFTLHIERDSSLQFLSEDVCRIISGQYDHDIDDDFTETWVWSTQNPLNGS